MPAIIYSETELKLIHANSAWRHGGRSFLLGDQHLELVLEAVFLSMNTRKLPQVKTPVAMTC